MLKTPAELRKLEPGSTDVYKKGMINRYAERPAQLDNMCLADFVACYNFKGVDRRSPIHDELDAQQDDHLVIDPNIDEDEEKVTINLNDGTLKLRKKPKVIRFVSYKLHKDAVNFFRERLLLFFPWRNELDEIENVNGEEIYMKNQEQIEINSKKYISTDIDIAEIVKEIEERRASEEDDNWDEEVDNDYVNVLDYDDNIMQSNVMFELGQEDSSCYESKKFTVPDQISSDEYFELCDSLNDKQRDYLMDIISTFKSNQLPIYNFVSGGAGVGKSRLIKAIYQSLIRTFRSEAGPVESPEVVIVAFTGKAAHNVNGMTAHTAFSLPLVDSSNKTPFKGLSPEALNTLRVKLLKLKLVIIDEISMMGTSIFEKISHRLNQVFNIKDINKMFGGKSVIVFGDFNQLRPVMDGYVFEAGKGDMKQLVGNPLWKAFTMFELTEIMRQRDDLAFAEALNRLSKGELTQDDLNMFKTRQFVDEKNENGEKVTLKSGEKYLTDEGKSALRLFWKNEDVAKYNSRRINELKNQTTFRIVFNAIDKVVGAGSETEKRQALFNLKNLPSHLTQGLPTSLTLQYGVRYMVTANIDVSDGIFNGATGTLRFVEISQGKAHAVYLEFDDPSVGSKARAARESVMQHSTGIHQNWTPIVRSKLTFQTTKKGQAKVRQLFVKKI